MDALYQLASFRTVLTLATALRRGFLSYHWRSRGGVGIRSNTDIQCCQPTFVTFLHFSRVGFYSSCSPMAKKCLPGVSGTKYFLFLANRGENCISFLDFSYETNWSSQSPSESTASVGKPPFNWFSLAIEGNNAGMLNKTSLITHQPFYQSLLP